MAKKYLSLEEAAAQLKMTQEALKKSREAGDIRGFADRGNWKFREEDVEEFGRSRQVDLSPELPPLGDEIEDTIGLNFDMATSGDSNIFGDDDESDIGEQPTIIRKGSDSNVLGGGDSDLSLFGTDEGGSDSGVRLVLDSKITGGDGTGSNILSDSSKDIPVAFGGSGQLLSLSASDSSKDHGLEGSSVDIPISFGDSSQELVLSLDDDDESSLDALKGVGDSDSDVRLAVGEDDSGLTLQAASTDSDVRLPGSSGPKSDVRLMGKTEPMKLDPASDSDVRIIKTKGGKAPVADSDSDVRLLPPRKKAATADSDSDVSLVAKPKGKPKSSGSVVGDDEDEDLSSDGALMLGPGSGIRLDAGSDSSISLGTGDSSISLDTGTDSGFSLDIAADSGIALDTGTDSDISLALSEDSISMDGAGDSGLALDLPDDSGLSLDEASMEATIPVMKIPPKKKIADSETLVAIPAFDDDADETSDTDFELGALDGDSSDNSVLLFDDADDVDDRGATMIKKKDKDRPDETFDLDAGEEFDDEDAELEEELVGEDDEFEDVSEDVLAEESDFEESFSTGESTGEFSAQPTVVRVAIEQEWGTGVFVMTLLSTVGMVVCAGVMFDLVRYLWRAGEYGVVAGPLIQALGLK